MNNVRGRFEQLRDLMTNVNEYSFGYAADIDLYSTSLRNVSTIHVISHTRFILPLLKIIYIATSSIRVIDFRTCDEK
jgi:hypothetical protein